MAKLLIPAGILLVSACADSHITSKNENPGDKVPTYSNNGAYDDNGAEPPPNNGNQNFGSRGL